jgi:predicted Zn-dependent protease
MKARFFELAERLGGMLKPGEMLLCEFSGERSDFVRFNRARVRQAGSVEQGYVSLRLIRERRQASIALALGSEDFDASRAALDELRGALEDLPEDPWLLFNETPHSASSERRGRLVPADAATQEIISAAQGQDLVGIYAGGTICRGFANSLGQRNWHEVDSFNFDWSLYLEADKAVKSRYAGFDWDPRALEARVEAAAQQLAHLSQARRTLEPGDYRAYLAPSALEELTGLLSWGGFSARARQTKQSPLLRMESGSTLSPKVTMLENTAEGMAPGFQGEGFVKPARVTLIEAGRLRDALVSPRSAKEYGLMPNAGREGPEALELHAGGLQGSRVLEALDTGLYISNLWYLNFSDRPAGRITGMTRFATLWVERGHIVAPVTPMRFDDSIYRMLGENLVDLTRERELLPDVSTYGERSTSASHLPGALISSLKFTL